MTDHITLPATPADRLRALRKRMKLSQKGFSDVIGVSSRNIENWEQGRYCPSPGIMVLVDLMERGIISDVRPAAAPDLSEIDRTLKSSEILPEIVLEEEKI